MSNTQISGKPMEPESLEAQIIEIRDLYLESVEQQRQAQMLLQASAHAQKELCKKLWPLVQDFGPTCQCGKKMALRFMCDGHRFFSCPDWKVHKGRQEKCSMDYVSWLTGLAAAGSCCEPGEQVCSPSEVQS